MAPESLATEFTEKRGSVRAKKKSPSAGPVISHLAFDKYVVVEMARSDIKGADYNPRIISEEERKRLRQILRRHGMVMPPVWNKRSVEQGWPAGESGVLVGGHQRLNQLDAIHGSPNYTLQVAVIDVRRKVEIEINLALNNSMAAGDWDLDKLGVALKTPDLDLSATGFDASDIFSLLGDLPFENEAAAEDLAQHLRETREAFDNASAKTAAKSNLDFYSVIVHRDVNARRAFHASLGLDDNRYQGGEVLIQRMKERSFVATIPSVPTEAGTRREVVADSEIPAGQPT